MGRVAAVDAGEIARLQDAQIRTVSATPASIRWLHDRRLRPGRSVSAGRAERQDSGGSGRNRAAIRSSADSALPLRLPARIDRAAGRGWSALRQNRGRAGAPRENTAPRGRGRHRPDTAPLRRALVLACLVRWVASSTIGKYPRWWWRPCRSQGNSMRDGAFWVCYWHCGRKPVAARCKSM